MRFSVVIPTYNQAQYLESAIESVFAQSYTGWELIVVNDGSTDATPGILSAFEGDGRFKAIHQNNRGLAAARNAGIRAATGHYVALLDSDDEWQPDYLKTISAAIAANPNATIFYCFAQCMDEAGNVLPQLAGAKQVVADKMYETLLNANFLIPSTVTVKRTSLLEVSGFDETRPAMHGCEDWDLWLRLARSHAFVSVPVPLVRYRLHNASMSADTAKMEAAVLSVMEKHFGPDDGKPDSWPADKRKAYSGYHRYVALTRVLRRGDWDSAAAHLAKALLINPALATDMDLFYELALGEQPLGQRGRADGLDLDQNANRLTKILTSVFISDPPALAQVKQLTMSTAYWCIGLLAYNSGNSKQSRHYLLHALQYRPALLLNNKFMGTFVRSWVAGPVLNQIRARKQSASRA
jgi:glycosyltransferase involved in cell wall biosynthesis